MNILFVKCQARVGSLYLEWLGVVIVLNYLSLWYILVSDRGLYCEFVSHLSRGNANGHGVVWDQE